MNLRLGDKYPSQSALFFLLFFSSENECKIVIIVMKFLACSCKWSVSLVLRFGDQYPSRLALLSCFLSSEHECKIFIIAMYSFFHIFHIFMYLFYFRKD